MVSRTSYSIVFLRLGSWDLARQWFWPMQLIPTKKCTTYMLPKMKEVRRSWDNFHLWILFPPFSSTARPRRFQNYFILDFIVWSIFNVFSVIKPNNILGWNKLGRFTVCKGQVRCVTNFKVQVWDVACRRPIL